MILIHFIHFRWSRSASTQQENRWPLLLLLSFFLYIWPAFLYVAYILQYVMDVCNHESKKSYDYNIQKWNMCLHFLQCELFKNISLLMQIHDSQSLKLGASSKIYLHIKNKQHRPTIEDCVGNEQMNKMEKRRYEDSGGHMSDTKTWGKLFTANNYNRKTSLIKNI